MGNKSSNSSSGIGLCGVVFVVFLILKLAEIGQVAHWSWWWVTSPLWIPVAVAIFFLIGIVISAVITVRKKIKNEAPKYTLPKSKFQERLDEMAKKRNA